MRPTDDLRAAPVTLAIAGATAASWLIAWLGGLEEAAALAGGFVPALVGAPAGTGGPVPFWLRPLTALLVHWGFVHLAFNLLILLFCGREIERVLGRAGLVILYLLGACAAAAAHYAAGPAETVPMVGASGAVSAVVGAYGLTFGRHRVRIAHHGLAALVHALWLGAAWIGLQALTRLAYGSTGLGFTVAACAAGFLVGLILARPLLLLKWRGA